MSENGLGAQVAATVAEAFAALGRPRHEPTGSGGPLARAGIDVTLDDGAHAALAGLLPGGQDLDTLLAVAADVAEGEPITAADVVVALDAADDPSSPSSRASPTCRPHGSPPCPRRSTTPTPGPTWPSPCWTSSSPASSSTACPRHTARSAWPGCSTSRVDPATGASRSAVDWSRVGDLLSDPSGAVLAADGWGGQLVHERLPAGHPRGRPAVGFRRHADRRAAPAVGAVRVRGPIPSPTRQAVRLPLPGTRAGAGRRRHRGGRSRPRAGRAGDANHRPRRRQPDHGATAEGHAPWTWKS